jgi:hypothetical protein
MGVWWVCKQQHDASYAAAWYIDRWYYMGVWWVCKLDASA